MSMNRAICLRMYVILGGKNATGPKYYSNFSLKIEYFWWWEKVKYFHLLLILKLSIKKYVILVYNKGLLK